MSPLVSILIPAYNAERWIADSLASAVAQTWPVKEIIVVDDGSTDHTLALARHFEPDGVRCVRQENSGASSARNAALQLAQGDYIQWLDADDVLAPGKIEHQMKHVVSGISGRTLLSSAWARFYYRIEKARSAENLLWKTIDPVDWMLGKIGENGWMAIEAWLVSRTLIDLVGPWDTSLSVDDDGEYISRLVCASDLVLFEPRAMSYVRQANLGSLSRGKAGAGSEKSQMRSMTLQIRNLRTLEDSQRVQAASVRYLQRWLLCFYPEHGDIVAEAGELAKALGSELTTPTPRPKYILIQKLIGWRWTKKLARLAPYLREWFAIATDRLLFYATGSRKNVPVVKQVYAVARGAS